MCECFPGQWLERWLSTTNIMADLSQNVCSEVPELIVPWGGIATSRGPLVVVGAHHNLMLLDTPSVFMGLWLWPALSS